MKCVITTFWQYAITGLKEVYGNPNASRSKSSRFVGILMGLAIGFFVVWLAKLLSVWEMAITVLLWTVAIFALIDLIAIIIFLIISWQKSVMDCWDKL